MVEHAVVIAGGGPTGLMLAGELALAGVDVAIVERRTGRELESSRARGLHSRTIEVLDQRGIADRFLSEGQEVQIATFAMTTLDMSDFPTRHNYGLALLQNRFEEILGGWVDELPVRIYRGREVTGFAQDETGVHVRMSNGESLRAAYLVGCDGGRSLIRKTAGIEFAGWDASTSYLIAEAETSEQPEFGVRRDEKGVHAIGPHEDGKRVGIVVRERNVGQTGEPTLGDLSQELTAARGTDYGVHNPTWISRFTDMTRQAVSYRQGRVLLAGDAAHVHTPMGGQGLNTGVQDAVNLGWKLAQVLNGTSPDSLLDTYQAERHPVGARVQRDTMALTALSRSEPRIDALREIVSEVVSMNEPRKRLAGHPLLGRRMPDLDLVTADGTRRVFSLLHTARPVLLNLADPGGLDSSPRPKRVQLIDAGYDGRWELPVLGTVTAPTAVLVRPDGHVAWVADGIPEGLDDTLTRWFGPPATG
jgi:3-(3-hydroxy-phenyl)propionate hydroxylase